MLAKNLSPTEMLQHINSASQEMREYIAMYIDEQFLSLMMNDDSSTVRREVADRINKRHLPAMMYDVDVNVRLRVARRIDRKNALLMSGIDKNSIVRHVAFKNAMNLWVKR